MVFLGLIAIPVVGSLLLLFVAHHRLSLLEFLAMLAVQCLIAVACMAALYTGATGDYEVLNGTITSKESVRTSCSHSYSCRCYNRCSGSGKNRSCRRSCSTCYEHPYDMSWYVRTNVPGNQSFSIERVNRQGTTEPPRWSRVVVGEPAAFQNSYTNYIKAAPDSLFRATSQVKKYEKVLPVYPIRTYDYHHLDRMVLVNGATLSDLPAWNKKLEETNGLLGPQKQVNVVIVVVKGLPHEFFNALSQHWLGSKKNDVIVVLGTNDGTTFSWVDVMSWTDHRLMNIKLRNDLLELNAFDLLKIHDLTRTHVSAYFVRKPMKDFEYLKASITPTVPGFVLCCILGIFAAIGMGIFFVKEDPFRELEEQWGLRKRDGR